MQINRYLQKPVAEWLGQRAVFIGGPRQVGKTHLAKSFIKTKDSYLSWDDLRDRALLKTHQLPGDPPILILDEIHKYPRWRMLLKGFIDKNTFNQSIIVTGSARLDHFRKGGDSLFGRYHYMRLHPLSIPEVGLDESTSASLLKFGGFPEPFIKQSQSFLKIWQRERIMRVIQQDLRELTHLKDYLQLELLADLLPSKVGSLLSIKSIAEDLEKSPHTIEHWISILESIYQCYLISPYGPPKIKAIKKQKKLFLWDWTTIDNEGARFENFVASHLLKWCHFIEDTEGDRMELRFLRDQFNHEIDFVVIKNKAPLFAVECKSGDRGLSKSLRFYKERVSVPKFYQVHQGSGDRVVEGVRILPFWKFCQIEGLI